MIAKLGKEAILISPRYSADTFWSFKGADRYVPKNKYGLPKVLLPPLGLLELGGELRRRGLFDNVRLIDRNVDGRRLEDIIGDATHVFMGGMIAQEEHFIEDATKIKLLGLPLTVGGPVVSQRSKLLEIADFLVQYEGETILDKLLENLARLNPANSSGGNLLVGSFAKPEQFWRPDYSLLADPNDYMNMAIEIFRGCPYTCKFCNEWQRTGNAVRMTPLEYTLDSMRQLFSLGIKHPLFIVDNNFTGNPALAIEVLSAIINLEREEFGGYRYEKLTEFTLRLGDDKHPLHKPLRRKMYEANFCQGFIGTETINKAALEGTNKKHNLGNIKDSILRIMREVGCAISSGYIFGFDEDTLEDAQRLAEHINSMPIPMAMAGPLMSIEGTELHRELLAHKVNGINRILDDFGGNNTAASFNFIPMNFSAKDGEAAYVRLMQQIYNPDAFFGRVLEELRITSQSDSRNSRSFYDSVYAVVRIFTGPNAQEYWKHLPEVHRIARQKGYGPFSQDYMTHLARYVVNCARFTHFHEQVGKMEEAVANRTYSDVQTKSWREIQEQR